MSETPAPAPAPKRTGLHPLAITGIVVGALVLLSSIAYAVTIVIQTAVETVQSLPTDLFGGGEDDGVVQLPLATGDPGSPVAVAPLNCVDACFNGAIVGDSILSDEVFDDLGLTEKNFEWGSYPESSASVEYRYAVEGWRDFEGSPDECFVTTVVAPVALPVDAEVGSVRDPVHFTVSRVSADGYSYIDQTVRLFNSTDAAAEHMALLDSGLQSCTSYRIGTGAEMWAADVSRSPAVAVPDSVSTVGWVEVSAFGRFYGFDVQRGNAVVRTMLSASDITEADARELLGLIATRMETFEPTGTVLK